MNPIVSIQISNKNPNQFALFNNESILYICDKNSEHIKKYAVMSNITTDKSPIKIYFHHPYVCISQRFGLNANVVNIDNGKIMQFKRKDYNADVSSYSIGFIENQGQILLIHQTQWNRLDITNLGTGELLTKREVICNKISDGYKDKEGIYIDPKYEYTNYLDYFHSLLHISPDYKKILSNGWIWHPVDNIICFTIEDFLKTYELSHTAIDYANGYNWDRPCTFISDDEFVIAVDNDTSNLDTEELKNYEYKVFSFYRLRDKQNDMCLKSYKQISCDVFGFNTYGELAGELYFDKQTNVLVVISDKGGFFITQDGSIIKSFPELARKSKNTHSDFDSVYTKDVDWYYSIEHHIFYSYSNIDNKILVKNCNEQYMFY